MSTCHRAGMVEAHMEAEGGVEKVILTRLRDQAIMVTEVIMARETGGPRCANSMGGHNGWASIDCHLPLANDKLLNLNTNTKWQNAFHNR